MKTSFSTASLTLDDIVFAHRNRDYGAYQLRQSYPKTLRKALLIGIAVFLGMFLLPTLYFQWKPAVHSPSYREVNLSDLKIEKIEKVIPPVEKPKPLPPQQATQRYVMPEVMTQPPREEPPPPIQTLENAAPAQNTQIGTGDAETVVAPPEDLSISDNAKIIEKPAEEPLWSGAIEIQPEFPGGLRAMSEFLAKNLKYPSPAQRSGIQGKVYLSFVIDTDGALADIQVVRGIGFGCDEEAIRVLKLMPQWKPGRQSGRAVKVKFSMPVVFVLE